VSVGLEANAADVLPELLARGFEAEIVTDQTSAHDPLNGYVPNLMPLEQAVELRGSDPDEYVRRSRATMAAHCAAMVGFLDAGSEVFDYGDRKSVV
jgi:urocanate hydratase